MKDYLLFIDTETSGLPRKWDQPYANQKNWPNSVQIAWLIYSKNGELIKQENHYIKDNDFKIKSSALKIHGIAPEFLIENGEYRKDIMQILADDLNQYQPLIVGHFMELDLHMIAADFYRAGIENPAKNLPSFCTMRSTSKFVKNPSVNYLRLGELYALLFNDESFNEHNALEDAQATAKCFFELLKRGDVDSASIEKQLPIPLPYIHKKLTLWSVIVISTILITFLIAYLL